jgi:hypothetical protein
LPQDALGGAPELAYSFGLNNYRGPAPILSEVIDQQDVVDALFLESAEQPAPVG